MTATNRAVTYRGSVIGWWLTDRRGLCRYLSTRANLGMTYAERFGSSVER